MKEIPPPRAEVRGHGAQSTSLRKGAESGLKAKPRALQLRPHTQPLLAAITLQSDLCGFLFSKIYCDKIERKRGYMKPW